MSSLRNVRGVLDVASAVFLGPCGAGLGAAVSRILYDKTEPLTTGALKVAVPVLEGMSQRLDAMDHYIRARSSLSAETNRRPEIHRQPGMSARRFGAFHATAGFRPSALHR